MNINAYRYETKVMDNGMIQIPDFKNLVNKDIEVFIILKQPYPDKAELRVDKFIEKWAGFIATPDIDNLKYDYLMEKYK